MNTHSFLKRLLLFYFVFIGLTAGAQSFYEIKFSDKNNNQYKCLLVYFHENSSYIRTAYQENGKYNVVEVNYKMIYGTTSTGLKYSMLKKVSNPTFITPKAVGQSYNPDYFIWFFNNVSGKYDDLYTTDDSTFNNQNYRKVNSYIPLNANITDSYLKEFFSTSENKYAVLKKMTGNTSVFLKPLPKLETTKLHLIIVANTNDVSIGKSCETDRERLIKEFQQTANALGIGFKDYVVEGDDFSKANLLSTLSDVYPGNNDIVLFIYRGHGFRWANENEKWPRLALFYGKTRPVTDNSNSINLKEVKNILDKKGARLSIVLGDCCNNGDGISVMTSNAYWDSQVTAFTDVSKLRNLFINSKGSIISSAAQPGEVSYAGYDGGLYTRSFISALDFETSYSTRTGATKWDNILSSTVKIAYNKSLYCKSTQTGISEIKVSAPY
ncbi:MAG TPA: hypothetical protein VK492_12595 [Chitinophagaceae bacterium]|nr:hypothetical protein [Chitinophagaceae bacterium]